MAKKTDEQKPKNLEELKAKMNGLYGKGTVVGGREKEKDYEVISTGSISFDAALNCGGTPVGKLIEIYGLESSGKSTITLEAVAQWQQAGKVCMLADFEYSFDSEYATQIGVDVDKLIICQPTSMEDGYNLIFEYVKSGLVDLIVIDSHTAMVSKMRLQGEIGDAKIAPEARINSDALRKIKPELEPNKCTIYAISQLRTNIGGMGDVNIPTGGNAWKFYSDIRIKVFKQLDRENETNETTIEVVKNKCGKPFGKCKIPIAWGVGIDKLQELINIAVESNIIKKSGSWYSYNDAKIGQGTSSVKELLSDNPELTAEIRQRVMDQLNGIEQPQETIIDEPTIIEEQIEINE